jgi:hypothetical protein
VSDGDRGPIAVGGVGGSGTRIVASMLGLAGCSVGSDLNEAGDNLWFTLLFKYPQVVSLPEERFDRLTRCFVERMSGAAVDPSEFGPLVHELAARSCEQHAPDWLAARAASLLGGDPVRPGAPWAWKEPNTHVVLDRLLPRLPGLRYVHVVRSGLDMAISANQNQARMWSGVHGLDFDGSPAASLRYWCAAQRSAQQLSRTMGERFLWLRFEDLCTRPEAELRRLVDFIGAPWDDQRFGELVEQVRAPSSLGRGLRAIDRIRPDRDQLELLAASGFATN